MIPYASCMCFGAERDRRRPWKLVSAQEGTSLTIGKDELFCINCPSEDERSISSTFSTSEICMLEALKKTDRFPQVPYAEQEVRAVGRRSRQPVITRMLDLSLLDDTYAGITKTLLSKCNRWAFNTFNLDVSTGGRSLSYLLVHLFQEYGFVKHFKLDIVKVWHCFNLMEAAYHRHNPYHNSVHAADVTQAMHCFLQENKFATNLTPVEAMSSVIAAVAHDLDHPGVTQAFLVATSNHLVNLYHNSSVLENHHWRTAISCLSESGIFNHLEKDIWYEIQTQIRSLILATDITRQKEFLARFKNYLSSESLDMEQTQYRHFALQIALKCADLCNPCRPWAISQRWSYQVCQEFYRQGAYERQLKLPLTPIFDCSRTKVAKIQADFFQFVVSPLFETWDHFLKTPLSNQLLENLQHNFSQWQQRMINVQQATEAGTSENKIPQITIDSSSFSSKTESDSEKQVTEKSLLSDSDVVLKQHRSKSDSGLTPGLLSPKIHMETYSTEELHPSTTLLSLSSITNTVQLRQVYAATKVESHLICPTVFQSTSSNAQTSETICKKIEQLVSQNSEELCSNEKIEHDDSNNGLAQCSCPDGCGTPPTPVKSPTLHVNRTKQRSQSLINDSEELKSCSRVLQNRRASDLDFYLYNNVYAASGSATSISDEGVQQELLHNHEKLLSCLSNSTENTSNKSASINSETKKNSFTSSDTCSKSTCICRTDSDKKIPSWCWHISRSFSAERPVRPTHDFDSPLPSAHGSASSLNYNEHNRRRGSAPVTYSFNTENSISQISSVEKAQSKSDPKDVSENTRASGRRWSIPVALSVVSPNTGQLSDRTYCPLFGGVRSLRRCLFYQLSLQVSHPKTSQSENYGPTVFSARRSSFGLLEPLLSVAVSTEVTEKNKEQNCSTFKSNHSSNHIFPSNESKELNEHKNIPVLSADSFFTSQKKSVQRRGSLPTDIYCSGEKKMSVKDPSETIEQPRFLLEHACRHGTPGDLLSVLIGPSGMLNTMHGIISGQKKSEQTYAVIQGGSRRRSEGLEMLGGLWRPRTNDVGISVAMASKLNLQRQLQEAWSSWRRDESNSCKGTSSTIPDIDPQLNNQQRRGSVPLNISLLSMSTDTTLSMKKAD